MKQVTIIDHPLVQRNLALLREKGTTCQEFRRRMAEVGMLMTYEATRTLATRRLRVSTPLANADGLVLRREVLLVPVLRAGLGFLTGALQVVPEARVGFVGLKRNELTLEASTYHQSLPDKLRDFEILMLDPMLATGGSAIAALDLLAARGARHVSLISLVSAPEGLRVVQSHYPRLPIYTASVDRKLNAVGYIVPGLGDAGDRLFGV